MNRWNKLSRLGKIILLETMVLLGIFLYETCYIEPEFFFVTHLTTPADVQKAIEHGFDINGVDSATFSVLQHAVFRDASPEVIACLVSAGADFDYGGFICLPPLNMAARAENIGVVRVLLEAGADPNSRTLRGETPLHHAACGNSVELIDLLVHYGSEVNARNEDGRTPLGYANELDRKLAGRDALIKAGGIE